MRRTTSPSHRFTVLQTFDPDEVTDPDLCRLALFTTLAPDSLQPVGHRALAATLLQRRTRPFRPSAANRLASPGQLHLGTTLAGQPYGLDEALLAKHLLAIGQSGAGKTTLFYTLLTQLDVPFWSFDLKQDYRHLIQDHDDLLVLPWPELKFNPLVPPPGVPPRRWAQVVSEIFGHATALLSGSKNYLLKTILDLYRVYGLFDDQSPPYPSLHELRRVLAAEPINYVRKTANYRDTVLNRVEAMTMGAGTIFDCSQGYDLEALLARDVVFEVDGLSRDTRNFLLESLLAWVYEYRLARTHRTAALHHVVVLDEGKQVFSVYKERRDAAGLPAIDELTAKLREFGEGLVVGDQEASKLTDSIKANTYTKVLLPTGDRTQFEAMAASMHLTDYQAAAAQDLDIGEAIVQTGNDHPVRVSLADYPLAKDVTDAELRRQQGAAWAALTATPREQPPGFVEGLGSRGRPDEPGVIDDPPTDVDLSADADRLLHHVVDEPFASLTERYADFASRYAGHTAKTELVDAGLVVDRTVRTSRGSLKLLELTDAGRTYVESVLDRDPGHAGRGGIVHRYWQHRVKATFEDAGWTAKRELFDADVYATTGDVEVVVEIAMENAHREYDHVKQHLDHGFDVVWVVGRTDAVRDGLRRRFEAAGLDLDRVVFRVARDFTDGVPAEEV